MPGPTSGGGGGGDLSQIVVKCAGLTKLFHDFWMRPRVRAVDEISFDIRRGEVFGLLGPNGSGKSTTIKMLLGLLHPTSGQIAVFGRHPRDVAIKNNIGYLPEESYLYPFLTARETLDYYGRLFHQDSMQRRKRIDMLLEMVGLERVARRPVGEYSKGMARRIGLAQALINDPQLLILDEPTSGMDPIGSADVKTLIQTLARRGKTILLCSHLLADVEDVCDRVAVMYGGKIQAYGGINELLEQRHTTTIQTQELDDQTIEAMDALLETYGRHIERVDRPRQKLEQLFLDIVAQARSRGQETAGASSGGRIAAFLETPEAPPEDLLSQLTATPAPGEWAKSAGTSEPQPLPGAGAVRDAVLENLINPQDEPQTSAHEPQAATDDGDEADVLRQLASPAQPAAPAKRVKPRQIVDENRDDDLLNDLINPSNS